VPGRARLIVRRRRGCLLGAPAPAGTGLFGTPEIGEFGHGQQRTADSLLATIATHSSLLVMTEPERAGC
jgi:hypothetical protein